VNKDLSALVLSSDLYASPDLQRFVFAVAVGPKYASFATSRVAFIAPGESDAIIYPTRLYKKGLPKGRGVYVVEAQLPTAGSWEARAHTRNERVPFAFSVKTAPEAPVIGAAAPRIPSPTTTNRLDVKPICTRIPPCPLHEQSLDQLVGTGTPVAVLFATPARCQSQYCGPVLDELLDLRAEFGDRIHLVHVEIYRSNRGADLAPTVEGWGLPSEPWLYTLDGAGTIRGRLDGAFAQAEIRQQLEAVLI